MLERVAERADAEHDVAAQHKGDAEQYHRLEGYAAEAGDGAFVYLTFVNLVKKVAPVGDEQNLRNQHSGEEYA